MIFVVEVENPMVQSKATNGSDERYRPWTPSLYQLRLSENHSAVRAYTGLNAEEFTQLYHVPAKQSNDYYTIADIQANGQNLEGEMINILVVVKSVCYNALWVA